MHPFESPYSLELPHRLELRLGLGFKKFSPRLCNLIIGVRHVEWNGVNSARVDSIPCSRSTAGLHARIIVANAFYFIKMENICGAFETPLT